MPHTILQSSVSQTSRPQTGPIRSQTYPFAAIASARSKESPFKHTWITSEQPWPVQYGESNSGVFCWDDRGRAALSRAIQILKRDDGHLNAGNFGCVILTGGKRDCHGC